MNRFTGPDSRRTLHSSRAGRLFAVGAAALGTGLLLSACGGQDGGYPSDEIEYIIPYNPGGGADPVGREFSQRLTEELGTSAAVVNQPGGDEVIGISSLFEADPDGYTLGMGTSAGFIAQPKINEEASYSGAEDFTPIARMNSAPYGLFVAADSEYETLEDFIEAAKDDEVLVSSPSSMGGPAYVVYFLEEQAGIDVTLVTTAGGTGEAALEVMSGRLDAVVGNASGQRGLVEGGELRALAYSGTEDYSEYLPGVASFEEQGYEIPFVSDYVTFAPEGLDEDVESTLVSTAEEILSSQEWADWNADQGALPSVATGDDLVTYLEGLDADMERGIELGQSR